MNTIILNGRGLTIKEVVAVARQRARVSIDSSVEASLKRSRDFVDGLVERGEVAYGITTGFGRVKRMVYVLQYHSPSKSLPSVSSS